MSRRSQKLKIARAVVNFLRYPQSKKLKIIKISTTRILEALSEMREYARINAQLAHFLYRQSVHLCEELVKLQQNPGIHNHHKENKIHRDLLFCHFVHQKKMEKVEIINEMIPKLQKLLYSN